MPKRDRRTEKTRQSILNAFTELMLRKRYSHITVREIIDNANVGRTTFYAHFTTKDELLEYCMCNLFDSFMAQASVKHAESLVELIPAKLIFHHLRDHNRFVKGMLQSESGGLFFERARSYWVEKMRGYLTTADSENRTFTVPTDIQIYHLANTMIGLIQWWIQNDTPYSPQEMESYWHALVS